jgi:hypothetical protein
MSDCTTTTKRQRSECDFVEDPLATVGLAVGKEGWLKVNDCPRHKTAKGKLLVAAHGVLDTEGILLKSHI